LPLLIYNWYFFIYIEFYKWPRQINILLKEPKFFFFFKETWKNYCYSKLIDKFITNRSAKVTLAIKKRRSSNSPSKTYTHLICYASTMIRLLFKFSLVGTLLKRSCHEKPLLKTHVLYPKSFRSPYPYLNLTTKLLKALDQNPHKLDSPRISLHHHSPIFGW
jgi:hypothetical protein